MKIAMVTNIPAPYRIPIYNSIAKEFGEDFLVIFCAPIEANRQWTLPKMKFQSVFLKEKSYAKKDGYNFVHNNIDVIEHLHTFKPDVIITTGYNPTHLYAWLYALVFRKKHIPMTDGWIYSEHDLSWVHRLIRKIVIKTSKAYIGASKNSFELFKSYGAPSNRIFQSHLCIDNQRFVNHAALADRPYHIMFSGAFHERKLPFFFAEIAGELNNKIKELKVLVLGDGPLKKEFFDLLESYHIDYTYAGYVTQDQLPSYYAQSKLFLFTTRLDAWGLVANEALASGTPVFTTPYAGIINDLLIDDFNGKILDFDKHLWVDEAFHLLSDQKRWQTFSDNAKFSVKEFNFANSAKGIVNASKSALGDKVDGK